MRTFLSNWNFGRILRLIAGLIIVGFAASKDDWAIAGVGALYALMAVLNVGCAYGGACASQTNRYHGRVEGKQEVVFDEIKSK